MFAVILFALLLFAPPVSAAPVDAADISNRLYLDAVSREIDNAKSEIMVAMYSLYIDLYDKENPVQSLTNSLVAAKKRGVKITVFLDADSENNQACRFLQNNQIDVYFIKPSITMHAKLIVIDGETVIEGSSNWTRNALTKNFESDSLIKGKEFAAGKSAFFTKLKENSTLAPVILVPAGINVPTALLDDPKLTARMVIDNDGRAFDFYLLLLKHAASAPGVPYTIGYRELSGLLGYGANAKFLNYARIDKLLTRLKDKYGLIDYQGDHKSGVAITLKPLIGETFSLPLGYWDVGLNKLLIGSKAVYLACVREQELTGMGLWWSLSDKDFAAKYHIYYKSIPRSVKQLTELDLVDIHHGQLEPDQAYNDKAPNYYLLKPLIPAAEKARLWQALEATYGKDMVAQARQLAESVGESNDLDAAQSFIRLIVRYGVNNVQIAVAQVSGYSHNNPMRSVEYVAGILRTKSAEGDLED